jgi:hypothetical protein
MTILEHERAAVPRVAASRMEFSASTGGTVGHNPAARGYLWLPIVPGVLIARRELSRM